MAKARYIPDELLLEKVKEMTESGRRLVDIASELGVGRKTVADARLRSGCYVGQGKNRPKAAMIRKVCPQCHTTFERRKGYDQTYCSVACRGQSQRKPASAFELICPVCHRTFVTRRSGKKQIYCSKACMGVSFRKPKSPGASVKSDLVLRAARLASRRLERAYRLERGYLLGPCWQAAARAAELYDGRKESTFVNYAFRFCRGAGIDYLSADLWRRKTSSLDALQTDWSDPTPRVLGRCDPEFQAVDRRDQLRVLLGGLDAVDADVLRQRFVLERRLSDIGQRVGLSASRVSARVREALNEVRITTFRTATGGVA